MGLTIRLLLAASSIATALLIACDAPNFGIVQAMVALWIVVAALVAGSWLERR